jgi:hypothetical protein
MFIDKNMDINSFTTQYVFIVYLPNIVEFNTLLYMFG